MRGFGAWQGSTCLCVVRAGLGEPGLGWEWGVPCPTALEMGMGGWIPAGSPGSASFCWCRWILRKLVAAWPAGPGPRASIRS